MRRRFAAAGVLGAALVLGAGLVTGPVYAHHKTGHANGGGSSSSHAKEGAGYSEDNDHNDGGTPNNVVDGGDNAHPSEKDRSVEHGGSGNQANTKSGPDDDGRGPDGSNGGPDKPEGSGGVDLADQDGNNGCGNDDDFEDDNEGWCGKPKDKVREPKPDKKSDETVVEDERDEVDVEVHASASVRSEEDGSESSVLGTVLTRSPAGEASAPDLVSARESTAPDDATGVLPFTGSALSAFVVAALALVAAGMVVLSLRRS